MIEPWFNGQYWAWLPGTLLGVAGGLWGTAVGALAPRGKAKAMVLGSGIVILSVACVTLVAGIVAMVIGQPYGVWYGLILPGVIGLFVLGPLLPMAAMRYREAEGRKMKAADMFSTQGQ